MCFDSTSGLLYVLGGNIHSTDLCSGLYAYNAIDHHWLCLVPDQTHGPIQPPFLPRSGHVMLFHSVRVTYSNCNGVIIVINPISSMCAIQMVHRSSYLLF